MLLKSLILEHTLTKVNKLRNIYTIVRREEHLHQEMGNKLHVFQNYNHLIIITSRFVMDKSKSRKGA